MRKIILVAVDRALAIGNQNRLPWQGHQKADMRRFVELTMGFPLIVGRKTYESFPNRPLPGRTNIVVTRQSQFETQKPGLCIASSCDEALLFAEQEGKEKVFVIGGSEIYRQMLPFVDELNVTMIDHEFEADTFFRPIDSHIWRQTDRVDHPSDKDNLYPYSFLKFERSI